MAKTRTRESLPIDAVLADVVASLAQRPNLVLRAPTGAGKTTRVAPAILDSGFCGGTVVLLQPRRVAARAAAARIALERGAGELGEEIGYAVRFDRKVGPRTRLVAMTEGVFVRRLQDDPFLEGIGAVVFDEFHERSLDADLSLAMTRKVQREARTDLRLVVMSATLDAAPIARFLGDAPVIESRGRLHPVEIRNLAVGGEVRLESAVAAAVETALDQTEGDVLVFLPGLAEIRCAGEKLADSARRRGLVVMEMYGDLPAQQQDAVLRRAERRKVVLSTNVAETSLTIENITAVVDSGLARVLRLDPAVGLDRLELTRISRASADQRAGRAGRTAPGLCLRLWSAHDDASLRATEDPEIRRVDLSRAVLELRCWGEPSAGEFGWFEAPEKPALAAASRLLEDLGATDARGVTELGRELSRLPLPPRIARLLIEGRALGCTERASLAAAMLSERDPLQRDAFRGRAAASAHESDVLERALLLENFAASPARSPAAWPELGVGAAQATLRVARDLVRNLQATTSPTPRGQIHAGGGDDALLRALLAAFPDRVARRRERGGERAVMVGGRGLRLSADSTVRGAELFVCVELDAGRRGERSETLVRQASAIEPEWLATEQSRVVFFDAGAERVVAAQRTCYRDLVLEERPLPGVDRVEAGLVLAEHAAANPTRALALDTDDVRSFLARLRSLARWMPELELPTFDETSIADVARELARQRVSFEEMRRVAMVDALAAHLTHEQRRALDRHAPERWEVPSGSRIRLDYEPGRAPVLAARIQELFGLTQTPRVAAGRVAVVVHLLAPNGRPEQVTEDLASFWRTTYQEVRRELRARYPRHSWPEDPLAAKPERKPGAFGRRR
ncbi:MAG: ATP-dependent helicase HrpB [Deltaproteobacteria bacterium]|nr:ATP-dependent helicase HrpB [Deltaproteobacteria bacterium]